MTRTSPGGGAARPRRKLGTIEQAAQALAKLSDAEWAQLKCDEEATQAPNMRAGIDLGLKDLATLSTGEKIEIPGFYSKSEEKPGKSQRARKSKRARAIHAKIANRRKDFLHKESTKLAKEYGLIVVGDVGR